MERRRYSISESHGRAGETNPSAEERVHVLAIQGLLTELVRIVERQIEGRIDGEDDWLWSKTVPEVLSRLEKAKEARGHIVGSGLVRLAINLPDWLPGSLHVVTEASLEAEQKGLRKIWVDYSEAESSRTQNNANSAQLSSPTVGSQSDLWKYFSNEFEQLAREEERLERAAPKDRLLRAYCDYKEHPVVWEREKPEQGCFCLLKAPETGLWTYSDGVSENFQARSRALTSRAGLALGSPKDTDPEDFWLHRLYRDLLENNSDQLFAASYEGGVILRVCEASATFCSRLERRALVESSSVQNNAKSTQDTEGMSTLAVPAPPTEDVKAKQDNAVAEFGDVLTAIGGRRGWISEALGTPEGSKSTNAEAIRFDHTEDYRTVAIRGETYALTPRQAQMIQILHEAHENVTPDVAIDNVLERLETPNSRWQDMWRTSKEAQSALIQSGTRKGTLRLNL